MKNFHAFLKKMGGMHDSIIEYFAWYPSEKKIEFYFDDIYSNSEGFPGYSGRQSGTIILNGVSDLSIALDKVDSLRVFEFHPDKDESDVMLITFWPSGKIRARFSSADYPLSR